MHIVSGPATTPSLPASLLIVEDDPIQQKAYAAVAQRHRLRVTFASRTTEVLRLALAERPAAILLDWELEDGQSLRVLASLARSPEIQHVPIAVVSGYLSPETKLAIRSIGDIPMLAKPWTLTQLLGLLLSMGR